MLDLFLGLQQAVEGGAKDKVEIAGYQPLLGIFGFWDYVMGMGMSSHGFTHV
jgi:hypothetical protein